MPAAIPLRSTRTAVRRLMRRHRRPLAAVLAGVAALLLLTSLRPSPAIPAVADASADPAVPRPGEVTVPVALLSAAVAGVLEVGDVVDLVAVDDAGTASVVAARARVVGLPSSGSALTSSSSAIALVAVPDQGALDLSAASSAGPLSVIIR